MKSKTDYTLYLVTDSRNLQAENLESAIEQAVMGGCTVVQLREKEMHAKDFLGLALRVKSVTDRYGVPLIINDRADIAIAASAAGVHIGPNDLPCKAVRRIVGKNKIVGVSVNNVTEALQAEADGADYLGAGAMFATGTKSNIRPLTRERLAEIAKSVSLPVVAIGGLNESNLSVFENTGITGIAVSSAIIAQRDITAAAKRIKELFVGGRHK